MFLGLTLAKNAQLFPSPRITQVRPGWEEGWEKQRVVQVILENCLSSFQCGPHTGAPYSGEGTIASHVVSQGQNQVFSLGFSSIMLGTWLQRGLFVAPNYQFLGKEKYLVLSHLSICLDQTVVMRRPDPVVQTWPLGTPPSFPPLASYPSLLTGEWSKRREHWAAPMWVCCTGVKSLCWNTALSLVGKSAQWGWIVFEKIQWTFLGSSWS